MVAVDRVKDCRGTQVICVSLHHSLAFRTVASFADETDLFRFYFRVYAMSPIPHEVHHLAWSLETLPDWPQIAVEHHSRAEVSNNNQLGLEMHEVTPSLSEQELDYIEAGLDTTYHPVVVKRLQELRELRLERNGGAGKGSFVSFQSFA